MMQHCYYNIKQVKTQEFWEVRSLWFNFNAKQF